MCVCALVICVCVCAGCVCAGCVYWVCVCVQWRRQKASDDKTRTVQLQGARQRGSEEDLQAEAEREGQRECGMLVEGGLSKGHSRVALFFLTLKAIKYVGHEQGED